MNAKSERVRLKMLKSWNFAGYMWAKLPLGAFSGMRLDQLDDQVCRVRLPGGWRTQNPFRSTYFAAQCMAAEMSTGAPALVLVSGAPASVAMLVREMRATFTKKIQGTSIFSFEDVAGMAAAIERAAQGGESEAFTGRSIARTEAGEVASEFEISWSFKRRSS